MSVNQHPCDRCEDETSRSIQYSLCDGGNSYNAYFCEECLVYYNHLVVGDSDDEDEDEDEDDSDDESVDDFDEDPEPIRGAVIATATPCDCEDPQ